MGRRSRQAVLLEIGGPEGDPQPCLLPSSPLTCRSKKPSSVTPIYMEPPAKEEGAVAVPAVAAAEQT